MDNPSCHSREERVCRTCGVHALRPLEAIAAELRPGKHASLLIAVAHVVLIEFPVAAGLAWAQSLLVESGITELHEGYARELEGECVFCSHVMGPGRRAEFHAVEDEEWAKRQEELRARAQIALEVRHG